MSPSRRPSPAPRPALPDGGPARLAALRATRLLASHVQEPARAGRYGGEEFAVVMPGLDLARARRYCRSLCRAVASLDGGCEVTTSIGVAQWRPGEEPRRALSRADGVLYRAKQGGRNRVETAD